VAVAAAIAATAAAATTTTTTTTVDFAAATANDGRDNNDCHNDGKRSSDRFGGQRHDRLGGRALSRRPARRPRLLRRRCRTTPHVLLRR